MLNTFEEPFEVTEMRTFKHEPFFIVGGGGGGSLFVVLYGTMKTLPVLLRVVELFVWAAIVMNVLNSTPYQAHKPHTHTHTHTRMYTQNVVYIKCPTFVSLSRLPTLNISLATQSQTSDRACAGSPDRCWRCQWLGTKL